MKLFKYGRNKTLVRSMVWLSLPIITAGKRWSSLPLLKHIINPFFAYPHNEVTPLPIHVPVNAQVPMPESVPVPQVLLKRMIAMASDIFILDACICRGLHNCSNHPQHIGCMALGKAIDRIHPSHGHIATHEKAYAHVEKAAEHGLIANIAHTWIDPFAFGLTPFNKLMFVCFCDDCCCIYRTHMTKRGPNLDQAYKGLPGISISIDPTVCDGCGLCAERCFVGAITMQEDIAVFSSDCRGCGRCVEICPLRALQLKLEDEDILFARLRERIENVADIS